MMTSNSANPASRQVGAMTITVKSDLEVELTRVFNAPRALVFEAHSRPEHMQRWWGPRDTTMVSCEMDFRTGGRWRYVLRKANGKEYAFRGEIAGRRPGRLVQTFEFEGMLARSRWKPTFTEHDGKTTLSVVSRVNSISPRRDARIGMEKGAAETRPPRGVARLAVVATRGRAIDVDRPEAERPT
jgi:uncharacterized protein YndB with AHSA1/START domain